MVLLLLWAIEWTIRALAWALGTAIIIAISVMVWLVRAGVVTAGIVCSAWRARGAKGPSGQDDFGYVSTRR